MKILISNDDGVDAPGINALASEIQKIGDVTVVAPHRERSTAGHALTLHKPLRIKKLGEGRYSTSGTPADCVYLGMRQVLQSTPDLVVSGINAGANLGTDIYYSGTVAAAREGALAGSRSYAVSLVNMDQIIEGHGETEMDYDMAARWTLRIVQDTLALPFPKFSFLNINIPNLGANQIQGVRAARQAVRFYGSEVLTNQDPRGKDYHWIGGLYDRYVGCGETDCDWIAKGWIVVTPIGIDSTHNEFYATLGERFES